ncbi:methyltransferase [Snodgrassella alvi]|uniref:methyltransferase n=1 Tax=Snodgrassella alvi TaxID=1196083 RepID=UPI00345FC37E
MNQTIHWTEHGQSMQAMWGGDSRHPVPTQIQTISQISAEQALQQMRQNIALLWRGDYHQGKQLLAAIKKRVHSKARTHNDFHKHRLQQAQHSRLFQQLLIEIHPDGQISNNRAPNVAGAITDVYGSLNQTNLLLPLHLLLGYIGAHEWHKTGVRIPALNGQKIHVPYGVFSPVRGEYLQLVAEAHLPEPCHSAWDIGTGSGVLAAILAQRGIAHITATDNNPRAIACAQANIQRLGLAGQIHIQNISLFPDGRADLIICNPPWLPAKASSDIETALYDPAHQMLQSFLSQALNHLNSNGQVWLIMSDIAEHLGLRPTEALPQWIQSAGLKVIQKTDIQPTHPKAHQHHLPLANARNREITSLWQLSAQ